MKATYLDNAATTKPKYFAKDYSYNWMNSNANYALAEKRDLDDARKRIMDCLKVKTGKVLFCRCATEAVEWLKNELVDIYRVLYYQAPIYCSPYEHDSVFNGCYSGRTLDEEDWLHEDNFYFHQYVNQLTGTIYDIESIGKQVQSAGADFGSDFTAAIGHARLPDNLDTFCSSVWFSGHKFGCEKGIGAIWISDKLFKQFRGKEDSKNNYGLLHGTVNVASAVAMSWAMKDACENVEKNDKKYYNLFYKLADKLEHNQIRAYFADGKNESYTTAINSIILPGINADALQNYLASKNIYVGIGSSACAEEKDYRVLEAYGLTKEEAECTIRVSFGPDNTIDDVDRLVEGIVKFKEMFLA